MKKRHSTLSRLVVVWKERKHLKLEYTTWAKGEMSDPHE